MAFQQHHRGEGLLIWPRFRTSVLPALLRTLSKTADLNPAGLFEFKSKMLDGTEMTRQAVGRKVADFCVPRQGKSFVLME